MKRQRIELQDLAARANLELALWKAARGRRSQPAVRRWLANADAHLNRLAADIIEQRAPRNELRRFTIHDPKRRDISAPCLADRVLHHAVLNLAEPRFEQALVDSSFACRPGRGVHAGVVAVQRAMQRWPWLVQVDVAAYFASIRHDTLLALLQRRFKGDAFLALLARIVRGGTLGSGQGLPIGSLTSQHFANAYLDVADRWLLARPEVRAHVRYMDDIVWWCRDEAEAHAVLQAFGPWIQDALGLQIKPLAAPVPSLKGMTWCGFDVTAGGVRPGRRKRRRFVQGMHRLLRAERDGQASAAQLQRAHDALVATLSHTDSLRWRQRLWRAQACTAAREES